METTHPARNIPPSSPFIRTAQPGDLVDAAQVYQAAAKALHESLHADDPWSSEDARRIDLQAAIEALQAINRERPEAVQIAEVDGEIVGIGAAVIRERHAHILFLFVDPMRQRAGIGRALLEKLQTVIVASGCDLITLTASEDRKAWRRYMAMGLQPGAPIISMRAPAAVFPELPWQDGLEPHAISLERPDLLGTIGDIDRVVKGVRRMADFERWFRDEHASGELLTRRSDGIPVGYYLISRGAKFGSIGPVAAMDESRFGDVLTRALHAAGTIDGKRELVWRADVPSMNRAAIEPLFAAGFYPWNLLRWFANGEIGRWDRYIFRDEDQL
ncbi:MAG TPA: GNAT family N-acetyltransferase [Thermomicrobiales bacterium]|nr:GNAT family N-acetyltransferase [Thermomicrobiales bacterium]